MAYRLTTCGLTTAGHKTLETLVIRQLRAILRLPAHLTQTTNQEVALQAGVLLSSGTLSAMLQREAQRRAHCQDHHVALPTGAWWKHVHASLRPTPEQDRLSLVASTAAPQVCPVCGVSYANRTALLTHLTKQHAAEYPTSRPEPFDKTLDAIGGLPQCSHCQKKFATWQLLQRHVEGNHCAVRHSFLPQPPADPVQPSMDRPPLFPESPIQDCINKYSSNAVYHLPNRHRYRQHCMLCGQWIASSKVMKLHYRQSHSDLANSYEQSATRLCQSYTASGTPCQYCGAHLVQPKAHKTVCPVLWQFCLNFACAQQAAHGNGGGAGRGHCSGDSVRQPGPKLCPILCRGSLGAEPDRVRASSQGCQGGAGKTGSAFRQLQLWWPQRTGAQGAGERRSQGPATNGGIGQGYGQAPHTPGDPTPDPQTELRLASLPATGDSWTDPGPIRRPTRSRRKPNLWRHRFGLSYCAPSSRHCCTAFKPSATMPLGKGLRCFRATYRIAGIISHSGIRPGEGQYTAVLCSGTGDARDSCWVVRDGRPAEHRDILPLHVHRQCYVLALIRSRLLQ